MPSLIEIGSKVDRANFRVIFYSFPHRFICLSNFFIIYKKKIKWRETIPSRLIYKTTSRQRVLPLPCFFSHFFHLRYKLSFAWYNILYRIFGAVKKSRHSGIFNEFLFKSEFLSELSMIFPARKEKVAEKSIKKNYYWWCYQTWHYLMRSRIVFCTLYRTKAWLLST